MRASALWAPVAVLASLNCCSTAESPTMPARDLGGPRTLAFTLQPPPIVVSGARIQPVVVKVLDVNANVVPTASSSITIDITDGSGVHIALGGTIVRNAVNGVATFDDLTVEAVGVNY